jgi:mono/diheme cytochrome c family protein
MFGPRQLRREFCRPAPEIEVLMMRATSPTKNVVKTLALLLAAIGLAFAAQQPASQTAGHAELFRRQVAPVFEQNCVACHGAQVQRSGLDLRTEEAVLRGGARGASVVPGKPQESLLYKLVTHAEEPAMPMGGKLAAEEIAVIARWIESLPAELAKNSPAPTTPVRAPGYKITDEDRRFWSFQKPVRPAVPKVRNESWVKNEVDAFILKRLEESNLKPAPPAEPRALLRRLYIDLTGLPPAPEAVERFVKDPSDAAYAKVVDELLASPQYGERWGRHWLDLARYADSGGFEFDVDRPHAWRYRDYVIKSFNEDKPYDQFIREQLAGDQLGAGDAASLVPTGFLRNGPTVDNVDNENEQARMDELDDMVSATSSVFLGLTVGCARCHDHKYDPIPTRDYYRMQAFFFPYKKTERLFVGKEEEAAFKARNKELDEQIKPLRAKIAQLEKPVRDRLLNEKVEFHVRLAENSSGFGGKTREEFRAEVAARFAKDVKLQPEDIDPLLSPEVTKARREVQDEIDRINKTRPKPLAAAMGVTDKDEPGKCRVLVRGDFNNKGEEVQPGLPLVLAGETGVEPKNSRAQLARWIASADNPLTARVVVNRIWQYHFGKGIVRTPSDFGLTGDRPSHPELLDWLATEFVKRGWSWKAMHRLIVTSNAYRQSSRYDAASAAKDPENKLLWRMNPRRVEAEVLRDGVLAVSGKLNPEMYGPGVFPRIDPAVVNTGSRPRWPLDAKEGPDVWRRSVYIFVKRSVIVPLIEVFDCPATTISSPVRSAATIAPQALALLNNEFVLEQARHFAERVRREAGDDRRAQVTRAFSLALAREPQPKELEWSLGFIESQAKGYAARKHEQPGEAALADFCHAIFNLNEFLYVD